MGTQTPETIPEDSTTVHTPGKDGLDAGKTAKNIAHAAIEHARSKAGEPPVTPPEPVQPPVEPVQPSVEPPAQPVEQQQQPPVEPPPAQPVEGQPAVDVEAVKEVAAAEGVPFAGMVESLQEFGISVEAEGIPVELHERYAGLLRNAHAAIAPVIQEDEELRGSLQQFETFKRRMAKDPEGVLLTMAFAESTKPAFEKVAKIVERAAEDPDFLADVLDKIDVKAQKAAVDAKERQLTDRELRTKGRKAAALTQAAAARHGVSQEVADKYVAAMIDAEGPDGFKLSDIDGMVQGLKESAPAPAAPRVQTPEQAKAVQQAPTAPITPEPASPAAPTPTPQPGESSGLTTETEQPHRGGRFRSLVRQAARNVDQRLGG